jgi:hypothetical protein
MHLTKRKSVAPASGASDVVISLEFVGEPSDDISTNVDDRTERITIGRSTPAWDPNRLVRLKATQGGSVDGEIKRDCVSH